MVNASKGFTLIEVMIVVVIIAILAAFAMPSYQQYKIKTERTTMKTEMAEVALRLQRYKITNFIFVRNGTAVMLGDIDVPSNFPRTGTVLYTLALSNVTANNWTLTATPKSTALMKNDGSLVLNSRGERCWTKNAVCVPSATSNWND